RTAAGRGGHRPEHRLRRDGAPFVLALLLLVTGVRPLAGALNEIGLPENAIPLSLLFFNVGVEVGQLLFVGAVLGVLAVVKKLSVVPPRAEAWLRLVTVYGIGACAAFWVIERVVGFA
ncbi:MAG: HupE/UreJ family protein, partial [Planctomycetota bacterium]|nr:HupE/UreJ family protein [Planctomycetota bacterium]